MIHTPVCDLLGIRHPVVLGGMAGHTSVPLAAAVSNAGGLGTLGLARTPAEQVARDVRALRAATARPFGVNLLLFLADEPAVAAALAERPPVLSAAWARPDQDLRVLFDRAHEAGSRVLYMAGTVREARRAQAAGADVIVAQGTEGGGHVGWMATLVVLPLIADAVAPTPVLAAGGIADGRGLAAALALGAQGALLGTRFLATQEAPLHPRLKQAVLDSDGHDTVLTEIPDLARGQVWPGAMARARRNAFIERWAGREWELRARQPEAAAALQAAAAAGDAEQAALLIGQDAGLIRDLPPAGELVTRLVAEAEALLRERLPALLRPDPAA
jgi:NAD(P)H-dependent flavin oxidoreductase YrpB (nitropropane dioxygenase family)